MPNYLVEPPTLFIDIDGTILKHDIKTYCCEPGHTPTILPGVLEQIVEWRSKGYKIILTTGRPASREATIAQLKALGIPYDQLVTDVGSGIRLLINDKKPDGTVSAFAYSPDRNEGFKNYVI